MSDLLPLAGALEASARYRRDTLMGGILHPGKRSFRELTATDAVHIIIDGNRLSVHVDDISPLKCRPDGSARYSWPRIAAHNLVVICRDLARRIEGRHGQQCCNLDCQVVWVDDVVTASSTGGIENTGPQADRSREHMPYQFR